MAAHPWVDQVHVARRFPRSLAVSVKEHDPVALVALGDLYLVDSDGRPFKKIQAGDPRKIHDLVDAKVLPHFNFSRTTQIAMGQSWRRATPEQQDELVSQFKRLLVRTYSGALASYRDQVIEFRPLRAKPGETEVTVRSLVKQGGTAPVAIDYDLERRDAGWKVFDVRVDGISLAANYRSAFADEIRNNGIDGLIALRASRNGQGR